MAIKAVEANKNSEAAGRMKHLREAKFETSGFRSNEPTPSVDRAREMASYNLRMYAKLRPIPSA